MATLNPWFGRLPAPDARDRLYPLRAAMPRRALPIGYRHWRTGRVLDQGPTSHCVAYAWTAFLESSPLRTLRHPEPVEVYRQAQAQDEWPGEEPAIFGTSVRAGAKVLAAAGHIGQYLWARTADEVATWVLGPTPGQGGPVVMGTTWYSGMSEPRAGRVRLTGTTEGGHAWLIYGYNSRTGFFYAQNSWGRDWGLGGRFRIHRDDLQTLLDDAGEACTAVETPLISSPASNPHP